MKIIFNPFLVLCYTAWLFQGRHLIGHLEWRRVILKLAGNSFHCRSRTASDTVWRANLVLLSPTSQKISTWKNLARVAAKEQNGPGLWKFAGESGFDSTEIANWGLRYISMKTLYKNDNCLFRWHPRAPGSCDTVVWIQPWTRNEKIGSKWVQTWMFGRQTFEFWEGARQMWAHRSL